AGRHRQVSQGLQVAWHRGAGAGSAGQPDRPRSAPGTRTYDDSRNTALIPMEMSAMDPCDTGFDIDLDGDRLREECGVFGIYGHPDAAAITALGLHALQHRGQEAAGIVTFDGSRFHSERRLGLVGDTFSRKEVIERLPGQVAVGHVRYSTTGGTIL